MGLRHIYTWSFNIYETEKIVSGNLTEEEEKHFSQWLYSDIAGSDILGEVENYINGNASNRIIWNSNDAIKNLSSKLEIDIGKNVEFEVSNSDTNQASKKLNQHEFGTIYKPNRRLENIIKIVAAVLIIVLPTFMVLKDYRQEKQVDLSLNIPIITKSTEKGQKLSIYLSDGSKVLLNADSEISYEEQFNSNERRVSLIGEAYFEVAKNPEKPFIVETGNFETVVLGTSFNINAIESNQSLSIAIKSGKVNVQKSANYLTSNWNAVKLTPGNALNIDLSNDKGQIVPYSDLIVFGWTYRVLYFEEVEFEEIVDRIESWYDVKIRLVDYRATEKKYSERYDNESLENVLQGLSYLNDFDFQIDEKNVSIKFK